MSWVHQELKKRRSASAAAKAALPSNHPDRVAARARRKIATLWLGLERINNALPPKLKLRREIGEPGTFVGLVPAFPIALVAENTACLGLVEDGIRYLWPKKNASKSNNFWLRWDPDKGYVVIRRVTGSLLGTSNEEFRFDTARLEHMVRCLVTQELLRPEDVRLSLMTLRWRKQPSVKRPAR
jgi:hypothetical protein